MGHAVRALLVLAGAVGIPIGGRHQFAECLGVAFTQQVAGLLPTKNVARGHAPWGAMIGLVASEKVEEEVRMDEIPFLAPTHAEDFAEQFFGLSAAEEMLLIRSTLIGVAG